MDGAAGWNVEGSDTNAYGATAEPPGSLPM